MKSFTKMVLENDEAENFFNMLTGGTQKGIRATLVYFESGQEPHILSQHLFPNKSVEADGTYELLKTIAEQLYNQFDNAEFTLQWVQTNNQIPVVICRIQHDSGLSDYYVIYVNNGDTRLVKNLIADYVES